MLDSIIKTYTTRTACSLTLALALTGGLIFARETAAREEPASANQVVGVARIIDGDTISIGEVRIRLEGIDAPELGQTCPRERFGTWPCGQAAADELTRLLGTQDVACQNKGLDKYGRVLGLCVAGGLDVNAEMVRRGLAWAFVRYSTLYVAQEADARARKIGIWQGDAQQAWEYRANRWASVESEAPAGCAIKGNVTSHGRIYHMPWSPWYAQIKMDPEKGKRWFCSEGDAVAAGWRPVQAH